MANGKYPTVFNPSSYEKKINCFKFFGEVLEIVYDRNTAFLLYVLTTAGEILTVELRPNLCDIKHRVRLPEDALPMLIPDKNEIKMIKTANLSILEDFLIIYSKITNKIYQFPLKMKQNSLDYNPIIFDTFELLNLSNQKQTLILENDTTFELNLIKHDEFEFINIQVLTKKSEKSEKTEVQSFYLEKRRAKLGDEDYEDINADSTDWWLSMMNTMKIPFYFATIFVVIGFNLWWRGKKKTEEFYEKDNMNNQKYQNINKNTGLGGGSTKGGKISDYQKFAKHERKLDCVDEMDEDSDDGGYLNEEQDFSQNKSKIRFSDEVQRSDQMNNKLEGLINNTNALAGQQRKIKDMLNTLKK